MARIFISLVFVSYAIGAPIASASILDVIRALVTINPLRVEIIPPPSAEEGSIFKVDVNLVNQGDSKLDGVSAEIFLPQGLSVVGQTIKNAGTIQAKRDKNISWSLTGQQGNYVVSVAASGKLNGQTVKSEGSALIMVSENPDSHGRRSPFNRLFEILQNLLGSRENRFAR